MLGIAISSGPRLPFWAAIPMPFIIVLTLRQGQWSIPESVALSFAVWLRCLVGIGARPFPSNSIIVTMLRKRTMESVTLSFDSSPTRGITLLCLFLAR